jgi:hypothetical protein
VKWQTLKHQAALIAIFVVCIGLHALLFKTAARSWSEALGQWPGLYLVYFLAAALAMEHWPRWRRRRLPPGG